MNPHSLTAPLQRTLGVFDGGGEPLTTSEVADSLDVGRRSTYERLNRLVEQGQLETKKVGASARVWWKSSVDVTGEGRTGRCEGTRRAQDGDLERYAHIVNTVGEPVYELDAEGRFTFVNEAFVQRLGYEEAELLGRHVSVGMDDEAISRAEEKIATLIAEDAEGTASLEYEVITKDGERIPVENRFSLLWDESGAIRGSAGVLHDITERKERERKLERQRAQLAALNDVNETVREITEAAIERSTRGEIEETVCERLATTDSYAFAWIGEADVASQTVEVRAEAGVSGYLDDITISVDPDDARSQGPTGRAFRTGEVQTTQDARTDDRYGPWREHVREYEFRSSAAIPLVHEGTVYGVLNVYAERPDAFEGQERAVVGQLGEIVGHAIAAAARKQALMSDEVVELQFRIRNFHQSLGLDVPESGRITIDHTVSLGDDEFLHFGAVSPDAVDTLEALVDTVPEWHTVRFWENDDDVKSYELRVGSTPVLSKLAAMGGSIERAVYEEADYHTTVHLAPSADVKQLIETFRENYPSAELIKRQQITRGERSTEPNLSAIDARLTDRQRTVLEAATYAGFFKWPREASGEDVAASLDIAPSTFSQHLRKAQRKVFQSLFSAAGP